MHHASTNPTGGASAWTVTSVESGVLIDAVSCPTTTSCEAIDSQGNILASVSASETLSYTYDPMGQVTAARDNGPIAVSGGGADTWTYNADEQLATTSQLGDFTSTGTNQDNQ